MLGLTSAFLRIISLGGTIVVGGSVASGTFIKSFISLNAKENSKAWFNQISASATEKNVDGTSYKFQVNSFRKREPWINAYATAKRYYDLTYDKDKQPLEYMSSGWEKFRDFCYSGLNDLKSKGITASEALTNADFEDWLKQREYWYMCINMNK